jgi:hypothetical protein
LKLTTPAAVVAERGDEVIITCDPREIVVMAGGNGTVNTPGGTL